jgi:putative ABC transport system permease protein
MSIDISHLEFAYGENIIFENLNLHLPDTGFVVILGSSGSGKTTFLSLLNGFIRPQKGEIILDRDSLSMVFQSPLLLDYLTVEENISLIDRFEGRIDDDSTQKILSRLDIETLKGKYPYQLSGGEMVRVSICRALKKGSRTLILDEPTGQLDEVNSGNIYSILKSLSKDHLIIMVTHDEINAIRIADYIYRLEGKTLRKEKGNICQTHPMSEQKIGKTSADMKMKDAIFLNRKFLSHRKFRLFFSLFFLSFNLTMIYLGLNLKFHMNTTLDRLSEEYYAHDVFSISMEEEIASSGNLHLKKKSLPDDEILSILYIKEAYYSLDYLIPSANEVTLKNKTATISFYPSIKPDTKNLKTGNISMAANQVVVNQSFLNEFQIDEKEALNSTFVFSREILLYSTSFEASDYFSLDYHFSICGIAKEKKAFNKAIVYYPYEYLVSELKKINLPNISEELGKQVTMYDMMEDSTYDSDDFKGTSLYVRNSQPKKIKENCKSYFQKKISVSSPSLEAEESTSEIISNLLKVLTMFLILNMVVSSMLMFLSVYSLYQDNIRLFALIKAFTRKRKNIIISAISTQMIFLFLTMLLTIIFSFLSTTSINVILQSFDYPEFLRIIDMKSHFLVLLISVIVSFFACLFPLRKIKDNMINNELEGED